MTRGARDGGGASAVLRRLWSAALDRIRPARVETRARAAAVSAVAAVEPVQLDPLTEAARYWRAFGGAWADDLPSMLLDDEILSRLTRAARGYIHERYRWWPGGETDRSGNAWPDADGRIAPGLAFEVERALRGDVAAVALARLVVREETPDVETVDVRALSGLGAANDSAYPSLTAFGDKGMLTRAEYRAREGREPGIAFETPVDFAAALAGLRARLGQEPWTVWRRTWDRRLFLSNDDGAHHLAAVHRYCREQGVALPLRVHVGRVSLDARAAAVLDRFAVWRVAPATYEALAAALAYAGVTPALDGLYRRERGSGRQLPPLVDLAASLLALPVDHWATAAVRACLIATPGVAFDVRDYLRAAVAAQRERGGPP